jgi:hypothetical protein
MISRTALLASLLPVSKKLEQDLRQQLAILPDAKARLHADWQAARAVKRTAQAFEVFVEDQITQVAVAWILSAVFVRFLEDNGLVDAPLLSGPLAPQNRLQLARDRHTLYFRENPRHSDVHYLKDVFALVGKLPGLSALFDPVHNPLWLCDLSPDGATLLLAFFQQVGPGGDLQADFTDPKLNTRFLGDLYQDLSERARKQFALLQTPEFVEEFILDRTLEPAIAEFGLPAVRLIDPACGSGHFLLGAFARLVHKWEREEPATALEVLTQRALDAVAGVDLNPFAVAIARFRLLCAALATCGIRRLREARDFSFQLAVGDSLLHGPRTSTASGRQESLLGVAEDPLRHVYHSEDAAALRKILGQRYHVVVANPPYITPKDPALNKEYRDRYGSCHMKYSLGVPFAQRLFELARPGNDRGEGAGYVGQITANSFMKREFGKKLIETYFKRWDLTHVIDTSGAYIPGHGTPTVILFLRGRQPVASTVRMALGIRGEPATPEDPARGLVWSAIVDQLDHPGSQSAYISVSDVPRDRLEKHPWAIGGGGAAELKEQLEESAVASLGTVADAIGVMALAGNDEVFIIEDVSCLRRWRIDPSDVKPLVKGDVVRDWVVSSDDVIIYPHASDGSYRPLLSAENHFWVFRTELRSYIFFGKTREARGLNWRELGAVLKDKLKQPLSITFAFVATHNHFVLDRGGKVFNRTAPVIKLPPTASEEDHIRLLGLLNSSTACFWMKQTFFNRGSTVDQHGARQRTLPFEDFWEHDSTKLQSFPLPAERPLAIAQTLDGLGQTLRARVEGIGKGVPSAASIEAAHAQYTATLAAMIFWQEELDWQCYRLYGIIDDSLLFPDRVPLRLGERAFEISLARKIARGEELSAWFERHNATPQTEIPPHFPQAYRELVQKRLDAIEHNPNLRLVEQPEYKRRWNLVPWQSQVEEALRNWLLRRLEDSRYWPTPNLCSAARLADRLREDADFVSVAALYRGRPDFDLTQLVCELVLEESVPFLAAQRYSESGLRKHAVWKQVWDLQRREDAGATGLDIAVPPKYAAADFQKASYWRLRGKLDVAKETFVLYPQCERDADLTPVIGWAGWDHKQQAEALVLYFQQMQEKEGWSRERLAPLLCGLLELLPWLRTFHQSASGPSIADDYALFVTDEARSLGYSLDELAALTPQKASRAKPSKAKAAPKPKRPRKSAEESAPEAPPSSETTEEAESPA